MKILVVFALTAVLYFELTHGLHIQSLNYRIRRDAEKAADLDDRRSVVFQYATKELVKLSKDTVINFKDLLTKIVEGAKKSDIKSASIERLHFTIDHINKVLAKAEVDENSIEKVIDVFLDIVRITDRLNKFDETDEDQRAIKKLFDENDGESLNKKCMEDFLNLRSDYEKHIGEYIASLTADEKVKEKGLIDWFEEFKSATGTEKLIETTIKAFEMLGDVDVEE